MEIDPGAPLGDRPADVVGTEPRRPSWTGGRGRGAAIAVGAVVLVGGGGAAALAASSTPTPAPSSPGTPGYGAPSTAPSEGAPGRGPGRGRGGLPGLGAGALHGTLTVPAAGAYEEVLVQRGTVTAVTPTSLIVKSADGYTHTYVLNGSTRVNGKVGDASSLAVDDKVGVLAGSDSTARIVHERGEARAGLPEGTPPSGGPEGRGRGQHRGAPVPGETPSGAAPAPSTPNSSRSLPGATSGGTDT